MGASSQSPIKVGKVLSAATTNATNLKASAAQLHGYQLVNTNAAIRYLKLHNLAVAPTPGTTPVVQIIPLPPNQVVQIFLEQPVRYSAGLGYSIVTGAADNDATAVAANEITGSIYFL